VEQIDALAAPDAFLAEPLYYTLNVKLPHRRGHLTEVENQLIEAFGDLNRELRTAQMFTREAKAKLRKVRASDAHKAIVSKMMNARYADPAYREKHHLSTSRANKDPARNARLAISRTGCIWITDGKVNRSVRPPIPEGWRRGRTL
jgi:hypothetical protein